jgi:hypothetical protein
MKLTEFIKKHDKLIQIGAISFDCIEPEVLTNSFYIHIITIDQYNTYNKFLGDIDLTEAKNDVREMGYKLSIFGTTSYIKRMGLTNDKKNNF